MNFIRFFLLFFFLSFIPYYSYPHDVLKIGFEKISINEGLSQSSCRCIEQDRKGFLWVGTTDGLNRYNGYSFEVFKHDPENDNSLSHNYIREICEDRNGYIWIGTEGGGLDRFDPAKEVFRHYRNDPDDPDSLCSDRIYSLYQDSLCRLWVGTYEGLCLYDEKNDRFIRYTHDPANPHSLGNNFVLCIFEDSADNLWFGTVDGLHKYNPEKEEFLRYTCQPGNSNSLCDNRIYTINEIRDQVLCIGTEKGISLFDTENKTFVLFDEKKVGPGGKRISSLFYDSSGFLWIGTNGDGLYLYNINDDSFMHFVHSQGTEYNLSDNFIKTIFEDDTGIIWIGTGNGGLSKYDKNKYHFKAYLPGTGNQGGLNNNFVWAICEDQDRGDLLVGTSAGINRINRKTKKIKYIRHNPVDPGSLCNDRIHAIHKDNDGDLWVATFDGLSLLKKGDVKYIHFFHDPDDISSISHNNVYCIFEDTKGHLWFGTYNGLNRFDKKTQTFFRYLNIPDDGLSISCNTVYCILEDSCNDFWVGTYDGLNKMDRKTGSFKRYLHIPGEPSSLSNNSIFCLYEDSGKNLWVGTWSGGVNQYHREKEMFSAYREKDGIANDVVYGIIEDSSKNLWMSTNIGLSCLNPATSKVTTYDVHDGLVCNEFNFGAYYKSIDGTFYYGTVEGLVSFNPMDIMKDPHTPNVAITEFRVFNDLVRVSDGSYLSKSIQETEEITLDFNISVFSFEFAALHYSAPERNQYAYMLEGFDKNFIMCGTRRFVSYTNLDPGEYTLRVLGSNKDGVWNTQGASLKIRINPPLWKTWWAYSLYIAISAGIIFMIMRYRIRRNREACEKKVNEMKIQGLKKLNEQRTNFFINIAHEIKTPITLIINYLNQYIKKRGFTKELDIIKVNIEKMARDIINFFDSEKLAKGKLYYNNNLISNLTQILKDRIILFSEFAQKKNIRFFYNTGDNVFIKADPLAVDRIINNLLDNAVKFTHPGGSVSVCIETCEKKAVLSVSDNGPGIPGKKIQNIFIPYYQIMQEKMKNEGMGVGLFIVKRIVESLNGTIRVESTPGQGSAFTVSIPLCGNMADVDEIRQKPRSGPLINQPAFQETGNCTSGNKSIRTVFIVEDNKDVLGLLKETIGKKYRIITAADGKEALKKLESYPEPDIIISDIMMDGMDGFCFFNELKKKKKFIDVPVIFLTAKAGVREKLKGLAMGAVDYIYKPFIVEEVLFKVDSILSNRELQRRRDYEEMKKKIISTFTIDQEGERAKNNFVKMCHHYNISPREKEVIEKLILGLENKEIAAVLNISINTVRNHISSIYEKCGVQNRVEFVNLIRQ